MAHPAKRKGDNAELEVARLLADLTGWPVRRKLGAGRTDDSGDLVGIPDSTCQVKNYRDITRAINECLTELPQQQANAGTPYAFGLIRRPGGRWFAVLDLDNLCALLREATEPEWDPILVPEDSITAESIRRHLANPIENGTFTIAQAPDDPRANHPTMRP